MIFDFTKQFQKKEGINMTEIIIIVCLLCFGGGGAGGFLVGRKTAVKTVNNVTVIETTQEQMQAQIQINANLINNEFESNIIIQIEGLTNIEIFQIVNGKTNKKPDTNNLPSWLKFPKIE